MVYNRPYLSRNAAGLKLNVHLDDLSSHSHASIAVHIEKGYIRNDR